MEISEMDFYGKVRSCKMTVYFMNGCFPNVGYGMEDGPKTYEQSTAGNRKSPS